MSAFDSHITGVSCGTNSQAIFWYLLMIGAKFSPQTKEKNLVRGKIFESLSLLDIEIAA